MATKETQNGKYIGLPFLLVSIIFGFIVLEYSLHMDSNGIFNGTINDSNTTELESILQRNDKSVAKVANISESRPKNDINVSKIDKISDSMIPINNDTCTIERKNILNPIPNTGCLSRDIKGSGFDFSNSNNDEHIQILYYKSFERIVVAGLSHVGYILQVIILEAICLNYSHVIIESFHLTGKHNYGKDIIEPGYLYYDYDSLSKATGIKVLDYQSNEAKELIQKYKHNSTCALKEFDKNGICPLKINSKYSLVYKIKYHNWWKPFECCKNCFNFGANPPNISKSITDCIHEFKNKYIISKNNDDYCFINFQVRLGDRYREYSNDIKMILQNGIPTIYLYIATKYCNNKHVYVYLASNGDPYYINKVKNGVIRGASIMGLNVTYTDKELLLNNNNCSSRFTRDNYALYNAEKRFPSTIINSYYVSYHSLLFEINESYVNMSINKKSMNTIKILFSDVKQWAKNNSLTF